ncbi:MAG: hypothetical protein ABI599_00255 [Flavobacteriales bacterium]
MSNFLVLVNLIGLFFMEVFFQSGISITHDAPANMAPGSQVKVTVTVEKGAMGGFAKLQIDLPEGLTATVVDSKGASFTFDDQKAKFIWMSLPTSPSFKVSYTLSASATVSGKLPISGRFSYIEDNERKTHELPPTVIDLGGAVAAAPVATEPEPVATEPVAQEPVTEDTNAQATTAPMVTAPVVEEPSPAIAAEQGAGNVSAIRTITMVSETELLVEVMVNKGNIRGFGKLQETLPVGFSAIEKNSATAIFTAQDRIAKFVWLNLPASNEVKITYKLVSKTAQPGEHTVNGEFGYLLNDETQRAVLGSTTFSTGAEAWAAFQKAQQSAEQEAIVINEPAKNPEVPPTSTGSTDATAQRPNGETQRANRIPTPETGVTYKVQITAAHREVGSDYFQARHHFSGQFGIERHEGWIKYTTGRYAAYKEARDQRQAYVSAGHAFPGPFVTAYNNGERITVQEALMISQQRWVQ